MYLQEPASSAAFSAGQDLTATVESLRGLSLAKASAPTARGATGLDRAVPCLILKRDINEKRGDTELMTLQHRSLS